MQYVFTVVALLIVMAGAYARQTGKITGKTPEPIVNGQEDFNTQSPLPTPEVQGEQSQLNSTEQPQITESLAPASSPSQVVTVSLQEFRYPNSSVISSSQNRLVLSSPDNTEAITDWYKNELTKTGANIKTFVTTRSNDKVLNELVIDDGQQEIRVQITKDPSQQNATLDISLSVD